MAGAAQILIVDTITHALLGALAGRLQVRNSALDDKQRWVIPTVAIVAGAVFPDLDYLLFWWDPYQFITRWHRGLTHSLVMLPLWAVILGTFIAVVCRRPSDWNSLSRGCGLGLVIHIITDVVAVYGTQIGAPISDYRVALNLTFDIDPWVGLIAGIGFIGSFRCQSFVRGGIFLLVVYFVVRIFLQQSALSLLKDAAARTGESNSKIHALPQPFSPFHWKLVIEGHDRYKIAYVSFFKSPFDWVLFESSLSSPAWLSAYQTADQFVWLQLFRFGDGQNDQQIAERIWRLSQMAAFRRFSKLPFLYRIDRGNHGLCVWFSDLRHVLPGFAPPFRYGMCRSVDQPQWSLYRIKRFTENERQIL